MARVTVEDCIEKLENRFELVMVAAQRARKIGSGALLTVERDNDKNPVIALREIAEGTVDVKALKEDIVLGKQRIIAIDEDDEDVIDMMDGEEEWGTLSAHGEMSGEDDDEDDAETSDSAEEPTLKSMAGVSQA